MRTTRYLAVMARARWKRWEVSALALVVGGAVLIAGGESAPPSSAATVINPDIHKIQHVIVIMQENRSFDSYFGTFPGADGIPLNKSGQPKKCSPDPVTGACIYPYPDHADVNGGGPHAAPNAKADIDSGKMDGFVGQAEQDRGCYNSGNVCNPSTPTDVMGY